ncbi:unnamed protein product [Rhizopus stolonifer]
MDTTLAPFFLRTFLSASSASLAIPDFVPVSHSSVDVTPFVDALFGLPQSSIQVTNPPPVPRRPLDSRYYRRLYLAPSIQNLSITISWSSFWFFSIIHPARNVWYRILHKKIPYRAFLHRINLCSVPDGACLLCGQIKTAEHLTIHCPRKTTFWSSIWSHYFQNSFDNYRLTQALLYLSFPRLKPGLSIDPDIIFSSSLLALWRVHWRLIYDVVPFNVSSTFAQAIFLINKSTQEYLLVCGEFPFPIPHVNFTV